jgi:DinB superfamily
MDSFLTLPIADLDDSQIMVLRDQAIHQLRWARQYSLQLIETVEERDWYRVPQGLATHLAWQVGHMAVAEYGLLLFRQRGRAEGDVGLMPGWLRKQFGKGSQPPAHGPDMPSKAELLQRLDQIHQQSIIEASQITAQSLREPCDIPYCVYPTKLGALMLAPIHEAIHAGQIGIVRRGLGLAPIR